MRSIRFTLLVSCAAAFLLSQVSLLGQKYEPVFSWSYFNSPPEEPLIKATDGNYYGTVANGGANDGAVVRVTPSGQVTALYSFSYLNSKSGYRPKGGLIQGSDGFLYGVNSEGGTGNNGTFFRISLNGEFTKLSDFTFSTGEKPEAALVEGTDGNFYGVATEGGTNGRGTIFRATPAGSISAVYSFPATGPGIPTNPLIRAADGSMYGITAAGGTFFRITTTGVYTPLHTFTNAEGGAVASHLVQGTDGNFYGTSFGGGSSNRGTVFKVTPTGAVTVLHNFNGTNGEAPYAGLCAASDSFFYGVTSDGGANGFGTVFRISSTGSFTNLKSFTGTEGSDARSPIVETPAGLMFATGTTAISNTPLYRLATNGALTVIGHFDNTDGISPKNDLVQDVAGNLYGTTSGVGGSTVFKITMNGQRTVLHRFNGTNGAVPTGPLAIGNDGNLYGVTSQGGSNDLGTVYRITPTGTHTVLHNFSGSGSVNPQGGLVLGNEGNFYGTTSQSGSGGAGQFYRITPAGSLTFLGTFTMATGANPQGTMVKDALGNFYGTTYSGGTNGGGTVFRATPSGSLAAVYSYDPVTGHQPYGGLWRRADGVMFGTTSWGGVSGDGTIYRITTGGAFTMLADCSTFRGQRPASPPIGVPDGRLFGMTTEGSISGAGEIYSIDASSGGASVFRTFVKPDGEYPVAPLLYANDGNLYGLTSEGGMAGGGLLFRLRFGPSPATLAATSIGESGATLQGSVNPNGSATTAAFEWGASPSALTNTTGPVNVPAGSSAVSVSVPLTDLAPSTTYYYRLRADNPQQFAPQRGEVLSFVTSATEKPIVVTDEPIFVNHNSAVLRGRVTAGPTVAIPYFERGDLPGEAQWIAGSPPTIPANSSNVAISANLNGLLPHTTYTYRAIARNTAGTAFGETRTFTTQNRAPVATNDSFHPISNEFIFNPLGNDTDADGDSLTITGVTGAQHGTATIVAGGISYVGDATFTGNDVLSYTISDGFGGVATATITLHNALPVAKDLQYHAGVGFTSATLIGLVHGGDSFDQVKIVSTSQGTFGTVTFTTHAFRYTPSSEAYTGNDSFTYTIADGAGATATATITLTNTAPVALPDLVLIGSTPVPFTTLLNDTDADEDGTIIVDFQGASFGTVSHDPNGDFFTYTPGPAFEGVDSFTYKISDERGATSTATVTIKADYSAVRAITEQGGPVPGIDGATWARFGIPSLFEHGRHAGWLGTVRGDDERFQAIASGELGNAAVRFRSTDPVPDAAGAALRGLKFTQIYDPVFAGDEFAFTARIDGESVDNDRDSGVWAKIDGTLRMLVREGSFAPGTLGAKYEAFTSIAMPKPSSVFFVARLKPYFDSVRPGANDLGVWLCRAGEVKMVMRTGMVLDLGGRSRKIVSFRMLGTVSGSPAHPRYDQTTGNVYGLIKFSDGNSAIVSVDEDARINLLHQSGPGTKGKDTLVKLGVPSGAGNGTLPISLATVREAGTKKQVIYDYANERPLAKAGDSAPGIEGADFRDFLDPVAGTGLNSVPTYAFQAKIAGAPRGKNQGIWTGDLTSLTSGPVLLAQSGSDAPGVPNAKFRTFESLSIVPSRGPIFTARLSGPRGTIDSSNSRGCWASASDGTLRLVFRTGDVLFGKTLQAFSLLDSVPASCGQGRAWATDDLTPKIIVRATFTDGTSQIVTVALP